MPTLDRHTAQPQVRSLAESAGSISLLHTTGTTEIAGLMAKGQPRRKCTCVCMSVTGPPGPYGIPPHHREAQRLSHSARGYRVCQPGSSKRSREFEAVAGRKPSWFSAVFVLPQLRLSLQRGTPALLRGSCTPKPPEAPEGPDPAKAGRAVKAWPFNCLLLGGQVQNSSGFQLFLKRSDESSPWRRWVRHRQEIRSWPASAARG